MKNEKILELLNADKIEELKKMLVEEMKLEGYRTGTQKNNFKKVANWLIKNCKNKPILKYCDIKEGHQIISDTIFLSNLVEEDHNPLINKYDEKIFPYFPDTNYVTGRYRKDLNNNITIKTDDLFNLINELKAQAKADDKKHIFIESINRHLGIQELEITLASLNLNKNDILTIWYNDNKRSAIIIEKENGSFSLLLPVAVYE